MSQNSGDQNRQQQHHQQQQCQSPPPTDEQPLECRRSSRQHGVQLSAFIGDHGAYQLLVTLLLFVRYVLLGLMANSGPLLTPDVTFYCRLPQDEVLAIMPNISALNASEQDEEMRAEFKDICQLDLRLYQHQQQVNTTTIFTRLNATNKLAPAVPSLQLNASAAAAAGPQSVYIRECTEFTYDHQQAQGQTITSEFDLVCDRDWLRSLFQSLISAAIVVAYVFWGTFSDRYGRYQAQRLSVLVSLVAGSLSVVVANFWLFTLARALCSFGDLGLVVSLTTNLVELVGPKYRGLSVALVNFGYALGVTLLPYIVAYFEHFRQVMSFTVLCHILTAPFILASDESVLWLISGRKYKSARNELKRIARINHFFTSRLLKGTTKIEMNRGSSAHEKFHFDQSLFSRLIEEHENQLLELVDPSDRSREGTDDSKLDQLTVFEPAAADQQQTSTIAITVHSEQKRKSSEAEDKVAAQAAELSRLLVPSNKLASGSSNSANCLTEPLSSQSPSAVVVRLQPPASSQSSGRLTRAFSCGHLDQLASRKLPSATLPLDDSQVAAVISIAAHSDDTQNFGPRARGHSDHRVHTLDRHREHRRSRYCDLVEDEDDFDDFYFRRHRGLRPAARQAPDCINLVAHQLSFMGRVSRLFKDKRLMVTVFTIVWTTFNSELLYASFIIINLDVGVDMFLNYILGGCMEALAAVVASLLLSYSPRRLSLIAFWLLISASCFGLSIAHIDSHWAVWMLALAKFSQSSLSSIASVAAYESFPTSLRQSGSGLVFTLGMLGSVFAPLIFAEFDDHAGMDRVLMTFSFTSLTAAVLIHLYLVETRGCELE